MNESTDMLLPETSEISPAGTDRSLAATQEARLSRVLDYQAASLAKPVALQANLGSINSGLMRVALWLDETIEQAIGSSPRTVERLQRSSPPLIRTCALLVRWIALREIQLRAAELREPKRNENDALATQQMTSKGDSEEA